MNYGYARCSTNESRQDISRQVRELMKMGVPEKNVFLEYESGTKENRAQLQTLLNRVQPGDSIFATEISRLSRSTRQLCDLISLVEQQKLCLRIQNSITVDCRNGTADAMTKAFLQITAVFAELERNIISERVVSGLRNARAKGKRLGRPPLALDAVPDDFFRYYTIFRAQGLSVTELAHLSQLSRPTVYKYIRLIEDSGETKTTEP